MIEVSYPSTAPDTVAEEDPGTGAPEPIWSAHNDAKTPSACTSSLKGPTSTSLPSLSTRIL